MQGLTWRAGFSLAILTLLAFLGPQVWPDEGGGLAPATPEAGASAPQDGAGYRGRAVPLNADLALPVARQAGPGRPEQPAQPAGVVAGTSSPAATGIRGQAHIER